MSRDFAILEEGDEDSARQQLQLTGKQMAVTVDPAGQVCSVWSTDGRGTAIVASTATPAADIAEANSLLEALRRKGTAIVVLSDARPAGVISARDFVGYLAGVRGELFRTFGDVTTSDSILAGDYAQGELVIVCKVCGTRNQLRSFVEWVTPCANPVPPHVLVRR